MPPNNHRVARGYSLVLGFGVQATQVTLISAPTDGFSADDWWLDETGFFAITSEYLKLAYCVLRYTRLPWYAAACTALVLLIGIYRRAGASGRRSEVRGRRSEVGGPESEIHLTPDT